MKHGNLILALLVCCLSCNNATGNKTAQQDSLQPKNINNTLNVLNNRQKLILALKKLQFAFNTKDKKLITEYFEFPLADSSISIFEIDSTFDNERAMNGNLVTRKMFEQHFDKLFKYFQMKEFSNLFQNVSVDSLTNKDSLNCERHFKNEDCYYIYNIQVQGEEITLQYGTNSDDAYRKKHPNEKEVCGEYASFWTFLFDGQKLHLKKQMTAG